MTALPQLKTLTRAYLLWFFLGRAGAHRFYLGRMATGIAQLLMTLIGVGLVVRENPQELEPFTLGGAGALMFIAVTVWTLADAVLIPGWVRRHNAGPSDGRLTGTPEL